MCIQPTDYQLNNTPVSVHTGRGVFFIFITMEHQFFEESVKEELKSMDQRLYDLEEKMNSIDNKLTQVIEAIMGNPLTKAGGVVNTIDILEGKIKELESKVQKQEEFKKKLSWTVGLILAAAMVIQYVLDIYSHVKK